jgi:hypothetical protein
MKQFKQNGIKEKTASVKYFFRKVKRLCCNQPSETASNLRYGTAPVRYFAPDFRIDTGSQNPI